MLTVIYPLDPKRSLRGDNSYAIDKIMFVRLPRLQKDNLDRVLEAPRLFPITRNTPGPVLLVAPAWQSSNKCLYRYLFRARHLAKTDTDRIELEPIYMYRTYNSTSVPSPHAALHE